MAHELTHVVQQEGVEPALQSRLIVSGSRPADPLDPLSRLPDDAAFQSAVFPDMHSQINALCDGFGVDTNTGEVEESTAGFCDNRSDVASSSKKTGCCCLCELVRSPNTWTINVTQLGGPRTEFAPPIRDVFLHPSNSDFTFGAFDVGNDLSLMSMVRVAGHELCGHAALLELDVHPADRERLITDVHDPTVNVENAISTEQGVAPGDLRGLARSGTHRGESVAQITVDHFPFGNTSAVSLPTAEKAKLRLAIAFAHPTVGNNTWVDILGHSDDVGSPAAKLSVSQQRANSVKAAMVGNGVTSVISKTFNDSVAGPQTITGDRYTRVEGRSDFDLLPTFPGGAPEQRRVDIIMAGRPAGAQNPIPTTPALADPVGPSNLFNTILTRFIGNPCERLLVKTAWS